MTDEAIINESEKSTPKTDGRGGARPGAGRKPGGMNEATMLRLKKEEEIKKVIYNYSERLIGTQIKQALGGSYLFKQSIDEDGGKSKPVIVDDPEEIVGFLSGQYDDKKDILYHYIFTAKPNTAAIENLLDRGFGRPKQGVELDGNLNVNPYGDFSEEELLRRISELTDGTGK